jgi:hypothetical protein
VARKHADARCGAASQQGVLTRLCTKTKVV